MLSLNLNESGEHSSNHDSIYMMKFITLLKLAGRARLPNGPWGPRIPGIPNGETLPILSASCICTRPHFVMKIFNLRLPTHLWKSTFIFLFYDDIQNYILKIKQDQKTPHPIKGILHQKTVRKFSNHLLAFMPSQMYMTYFLLWSTNLWFFFCFVFF